MPCAQLLLNSADLPEGKDTLCPHVMLELLLLDLKLGKSKYFQNLKLGAVLILSEALKKNRRSAWAFI